MPAPVGNLNAIRHGLRSQRNGLVHAKLGRRFASQYADSNRLRRAVEELVRQRLGSVPLREQARIQTLIRLEDGIRATEKTLAETPAADLDMVLKARHAIAQWTAQRDGVLIDLAGDPKPGDPLADLWLSIDRENQARQTAATAGGPVAGSQGDQTAPMAAATTTRLLEAQQ